MKIDEIATISSESHLHRQKDADKHMVKSSTSEGIQQDEFAQTSNESFPGEHKLIKAIEASNDGLKMTNTSLKFSIHEKTKQIMVKIIDNDTKEVVKEIPPEKILDMVAAMLERTGLFVDQKA